jgi:hypothetical protein
LDRERIDEPACNFQFCHSITFPSIEKLTPSGWIT